MEDAGRGPAEERAALLGDMDKYDLKFMREYWWMYEDDMSNPEVQAALEAAVDRRTRQLDDDLAALIAEARTPEAQSEIAEAWANRSEGLRRASVAARLQGQGGVQGAPADLRSLVPARRKRAERVVVYCAEGSKPCRLYAAFAWPAPAVPTVKVVWSALVKLASSLTVRVKGWLATQTHPQVVRAGVAEAAQARELEHFGP